MKVVLTTAVCLLAFGSVQAQDLRKFDVYGDIPYPDEKKRHDLLALQMQSDPDFVVWLVIYAPCVGEARLRAIRAKHYLVKNRGVKEDRVLWIDGGYDGDELNVHVWLLPRSFGYPYWESYVGKRGVQAPKNCETKYPKRAQRVRVRGTHNNSFNRTRN
jgi:hypothetical protein